MNFLRHDMTFISFGNSFNNCGFPPVGVNLVGIAFENACFASVTRSRGEFFGEWMAKHGYTIPLYCWTLKHIYLNTCAYII